MSFFPSPRLECSVDPIQYRRLVVPKKSYLRIRRFLPWCMLTCILGVGLCYPTAKHTHVGGSQSHSHSHARQSEASSSDFDENSSTGSNEGHVHHHSGNATHTHVGDSLDGHDHQHPHSHTQSNTRQHESAERIQTANALSTSSLGLSDAHEHWSFFGWEFTLALPCGETAPQVAVRPTSQVDVWEYIDQIGSSQSQHADWEQGDSLQLSAVNTASTTEHVLPRFLPCEAVRIPCDVERQGWTAFASDIYSILPCAPEPPPPRPC